MLLRPGLLKRISWKAWSALLLAAIILPSAALLGRAGEKKGTSDQPLSAAGLDLHRISLQSIAAGPPAAATGKLVVQTYDLAYLVEKFCEQVVESRKSARTAIEWHIERSAPGPWKPKGYHDGNPKTNARFEHGWVDDKLIVVHTAAGHEQIERQLQILRGEHGLAQLSIEVRILSMPVIALDRVAANWKLIGATPNHGSHEFQTGAARVSSTPGPVGSESKIRGTIESVVEKQVPAIVALLDDNEAGLVVNAAQDDARTSILHAPKVTVFNGETVRMEDITQRPFVVGVKPASGDGELPQIRVVSEGTSIRLRPELQGNGKVLLEMGLTLSHIRGVETAELPNGRSDSRVRVQVPEVGIIRLNSTVEMDLDQMLAIGLPATSSDNSSKPGCILVKVRKLDEPLIAAGRQAKAPIAREESAGVEAP